MKITILSNAVNHHTCALAEALYARLGDGFCFVQTGAASEDTYRLGYAHFFAGEDGAPWSIRAEREPEKARQAIWEADAVLTANAPEHWVRPRLKAGKLTFRAHERWYRMPLRWYRYPRAVLGGWLHHGRYPNLYMLCASAYTARDAQSIGTFRGKCFRWGYFPAFHEYSPEQLRQWKQQSVNILCAGRMVGLKRFEDAIYACARLKAEGFQFRLTIAGDGPRMAALRTLSADLDLDACFPGQLRPEQVRHLMERSQIFLLTSDRREGWGAVLNEAMNSGCAVVASSAAGATPYLVQNGINGLVYPGGDISALTDCIRPLLTRPQECLALGLRAYEIIRDGWTPAIAAERLCGLCQCLGQGSAPAYTDGPCSAAPILDDCP